jgi:Na+/H+ antiporter NhaD/arsenite permease-like protein
MSIIGTIISVMLMTLILNIVFKKFNILIDQTSVSNHKSFISGHKTIPLSGGIVFFLVLIFFFTRKLQIFKYLIFFYLFNRFII